MLIPTINFLGIFSFLRYVGFLGIGRFYFFEFPVFYPSLVSRSPAGTKNFCAIMNGKRTLEDKSLPDVPVLPGFRYDYNKRRYFRNIPELPQNNYNVEAKVPKAARYECGATGIWIAPEIKSSYSLDSSYSSALATRTAVTLQREIVYKNHSYLKKLEDVFSHRGTPRYKSVTISQSQHLNLDFLLDTEYRQVGICSEDSILLGRVDPTTETVLTHSEVQKVNEEDVPTHQIKLSHMRICSAETFVAFGAMRDDSTASAVVFRKSNDDISGKVYEELKPDCSSCTNGKGHFTAVWRRKDNDRLVVQRSHPESFFDDLMSPGPAFTDCPFSCLQYSPSFENVVYIGTANGDIMSVDPRAAQFSKILSKEGWPEAGLDNKCRISSMKALNNRNSLLTIVSTAPSEVSKMHLWDLRCTKRPSVSFEDTCFPSHVDELRISLSSDDSLAVVSDSAGVTRMFDVSSGNMMARIPELFPDLLNGAVRKPTIACYTDSFGGISCRRILMLFSLGSPTKINLYDFS